LLKLYLDSSAIVKRYVEEPGSATIDAVFDGAEVGKVRIAFSLWNVGEVLGTLAERRRRGWLEEGEFSEALRRFIDEVLKLLRLRVLDVIPVLTPMLVETWALILDQHIYEADAIQISTYTYSKSDTLLSADKVLIEATKESGLKAIHVEEGADEVKKLIEEH